MTLRPIIAANWKMNPAPSNLDAYKSIEGVDVIVFPTFLDLKKCIDAGLHAGGQYGHPEDHGAHTGDISMKMLADFGATHVLCGHSERRQNHDETNEDVAEQVVAAIDNRLHPILCIGETEEERLAGKEKIIVKTQIKAILSQIPNPLSPVPFPLSLAYEPIWAIGTGKTATPEDAQEMHSFIRSLLPHGETSRILYGGSMNPENAEELLEQPDIDGGLVGGASLDPKKFAEIVKMASR